MTDYAEEQANEFEALESIYVTELEVLSKDPFVYNILIPCEIREVDAENKNKEFTVGLKFKIPEEYPDIPPSIEFSECKELSEDLQKSLLIQLNKVAEDEIGCVMVFTLVSELQDKVNEYADEIYNRKLKEKEEREKVPEFHGTIVTRENFIEWHNKFILEKNMFKVKVVSDRLTGKQVFLAKEGNIELSDQLIGDVDGAEEDVEVDESLFDDDLDDDFLDDEDSDDSDDWFFRFIYF